MESWWRTSSLPHDHLRRVGCSARRANKELCRSALRADDNCLRREKRPSKTALDVVVRRVLCLHILHLIMRMHQSAIRRGYMLYSHPRYLRVRRNQFEDQSGNFNTGVLGSIVLQRTSPTNSLVLNKTTQHWHEKSVATSSHAHGDGTAANLHVKTVDQLWARSK